MSPLFLNVGGGATSAIFSHLKQQFGIPLVTLSSFMLRNKSPGSSLPRHSTAASIKSGYDSVWYVTLLIVRKLLIFNRFSSIYLPVDQK